MLTLSYTLFPTLKNELESIDKKRNKILCELLSPQKELKIRFETLAKKASSAMFLSGKSISPSEIEAIFNGNNKHLQAKNVREFKNAYDYIYRNWYLSDDDIRGKDILELLSKFSEAKIKDRRQVEQMIEFITVNPEHGIIQAALAFFLITQVIQNDNNTIKIASNVSSIFLYKYGYDFRGMLDLDEYWANDLATLNKRIKDAVQVKNLSEFLEYYVWAVSLQADKAIEALRELSKISVVEKEYNLTKRQKNILTIFDKPNVKVTNRDVQKAFKVSQITASRDLAKLSTLGLIFPNGRGRSVFYTKI